MFVFKALAGFAIEGCGILLLGECVDPDREGCDWDEFVAGWGGLWGLRRRESWISAPFLFVLLKKYVVGKRITSIQR